MCTDREKKDLRGPVQSVRNETAEFSSVETGLVENPWLVDTESFDEEGRLLEITFHNTQHPEYSSKQVFSYDTTSKLIEQAFYYLNGKSGGKSVYTYDSEGRLVEGPPTVLRGSTPGKEYLPITPTARKQKNYSLIIKSINQILNTAMGSMLTPNMIIVSVLMPLG